MILSNSKNLDSLFEGGLIEGKIYNFYGEQGSGRTNIAIQTAVSCIKSGKKVLYINSKGKFSVERFLQIGDKDLLKNIILIKPRDFSGQSEIISSLDSLFEKEKVGLIVVDSIVGFYRMAFAKDIEKANHDLKHQFLNLKKIAEEHKIPVLVTAEVYEDVDKKIQEPLGKYSAKKYSDYLIKLEKLEWRKRKANLIKPERKTNNSCFFEITENGIN